MEIIRGAPIPTGETLLQWGHPLKGMEMNLIAYKYSTHNTASMGPSPERDGNYSLALLILAPARASMGPSPERDGN